jgi:CheY-like chemotaxis protein
MSNNRSRKKYGKESVRPENQNPGSENNLKMKILIVEDEWITAIYMKNILETEHFSVVGIATTGKDAVQIFRENSPDFIIMDIILQGEMDGIEAMKEILSIARIPFVYSTATADSTVKNRAISTTPHGFLNKPFEKKELMSVINNALI